MLMSKQAGDHFRLGLAFAVGSALTFGMSGPFAKSLMTAGWSPTAAVTARLLGGALVMAVFATVVNRGWLREALRHIKTVIAYGLVPVAGSQLCYYNAVAHLSVGVALLLEYAAPILVVSWVWATTRRRPSNRTLAGVTMAVAGITVVLDVFNGAHVNAVGVAWGVAAALCAACYFVMSDTVTADDDGLDPITLAASGLIVGSATVALLGLFGILPLTFTANNVADHVVDRADRDIGDREHRRGLRPGHPRGGLAPAQLRVAGGPGRGVVRGAVGMAAGR
jgi:drug/metabolite transporter (DMT)-like permease